MLRCLSAEIWAVMTQYWENWEVTKSCWLDPLYLHMHDMKSICCKISLFIKNFQKLIGNEQTMAKQRWTESSCVLCKLVQHIPFICHPKLFGQCWNKNFVIFYMFCSFFNFDDLSPNLFLISFHKIQKCHILDKISKNCRWNVFGKGILVNNKIWVLLLDLWMLGGWTTKTKVWSDMRIKNAKTLLNNFFWNFDISDKKSADFSCLFIFFQKNC